MNLEELLAKLDAQNFGPRDSTVVSTINHPVDAIGKLLSSIQNRVNIASNPNIPDALKVQPTLDLAGGAQLGSMPFAPSGSGTLGSIKGIWKLAKDPELRQSLKAQGFDLTTPWYHGGPSRVPQGQERLPMFYTTSKPYSEFMAQETGDGVGTLHKVLVNDRGLFDAMENYGNYNGDTYAKKVARGERVGPLEYSNLLNRAGFKHVSDEFGFQESIDTVPSRWSLEDIVTNPADTLYSPKVQAQISKEGYKGVKLLDAFDRGEEPTAIFTSKPEVYELSARKTGNSAQLRKLYKTKPLSKMFKKKGP